MNFSMKLLIIIILCSLSLPLWSQNVSEVLDRNVKSMQNKMGSGSYQLMANNSYKNKARIESFSIQALARIFKKENDSFRDLNDLIKQYEDLLGEVNKWGGFMELQNISTSEKKLYKKNFEAELKNLSSFLNSSNFLYKLNYYNKEIFDLSIGVEKTKKIVIAEIKDDISDILKKKYNFTHGENGLHEFRRNLRWILYSLDTFKHFFTVKRSNCRNSKFYNLGIKSYYTSVKENSKATISINFCFYAELSGAVVYLGQIKEELEREDKLDQPVSAEISKEVSDIYNDLKRNILPNIF
jgi:hypothetical protein